MQYIPHVANVVAVIILSFFLFRWVTAPDIIPEILPLPEPDEILGADKTALDETMFALVDQAGNILTIIVADQEFINSGVVGDPYYWIPVDYKIKDKAAEIGGLYDWDKQKFINKVEAKTKKSADEDNGGGTATST
jgi:hypothetical protein